MSEFNYSAIQQVAIDLIGKFGRDVTMERFDQTAGDPLKPWDGPTDPTGTPDATLTVRATFVEPSSAVELGIATADDALVKQSDQIALIATPLTFTTDDLETYNEMIDNTVRYRIIDVQKLKPGDTTLLYFVGVAR